MWTGICPIVLFLMVSQIECRSVDIRVVSMIFVFASWVQIKSTFGKMLLF
jgi:hypothetical protein